MCYLLLILLNSIMGLKNCQYNRYQPQNKAIFFWFSIEPFTVVIQENYIVFNGMCTYYSKLHMLSDTAITWAKVYCESWRRKWQPAPVFLPGESHGQESLAGYSPWGRKESDTTEHAHILWILEKHDLWCLLLLHSYFPWAALLLLSSLMFSGHFSCCLPAVSSFPPHPPTSDCFSRHFQPSWYLPC